MINALNEVSSAQEKPFNLPEIYIAEGYDTIEDEDGNVGFGVYVPDKKQIYVVGDVDNEVRLKALFHELCHWVQAMCGRPFDEDEANEFSDIVYDALPSAQPRKGKWIYGEHDVAMCDGYRCDKCGFFVPWDYQRRFIDFIKDYNYCPSCGADMEVKNDYPSSHNIAEEP